MVNCDAVEEGPRTVPRTQKVLDSDNNHPEQRFKREKTLVSFMNYQASQWALRHKEKKMKIKGGP